jgi:hypothetical protein
MVENTNVLKCSGTMKHTFDSELIWMNFIFVSGFCSLIDFCVLIFNHFFVRNIYNLLLSLENKNNISYDYIQTIPEELQKLLLTNDKVIEYNKNNIGKNNNEEINKNNNIINNELKEDIKKEIDENNYHKVNEVQKTINIEKDKLEENISINKSKRNKSPKKKKIKKRKPKKNIKIFDYSLNTTKNEKNQKDNDNNITNKNDDIMNNSNIIKIKSQKTSKIKKPFRKIKLLNNKNEVNKSDLDEQRTNREGIP